jgi:hypothetical protein
MPLFEKTLNKLSRGLLSQLPQLQSPIHESKPPENETLKKLKSRIMESLLNLAPDRDSQNMLRQLVTPVLGKLSEKDINNGVAYLKEEISKLEIDGLLFSCESGESDTIDTLVDRKQA